MAGDVTIRPCVGEADLACVVELLSTDVLGSTREGTAEELDPYARAFAEIEADPNNTVYVVEDAGEVIGCYQLTLIPNLSFKGGKRAQVEGVRVADHARGRGIGEKMMAHAIETARAAGCRMVQLTSNRQRDDALRFYERLGFEPTHIGFKYYL